MNWLLYLIFLMGVFAYAVIDTAIKGLTLSQGKLPELMLVWVLATIGVFVGCVGEWTKK